MSFARAGWRAGPAGVLRGQRALDGRWCGHARRSEIARQECRHKLVNAAKRRAIRGVDHVRVTDARFGNVGHLGEPAIDAAVVSVPNEAPVVDGRVVTESVPESQSIARGERAPGMLHAVDGLR